MTEEITNKNIDQNNSESGSRAYALFYSFFLLPLSITILGVLFFLTFKFLTIESEDPYDYLNQIKVGSSTKRWQSAYELARILSNPENFPESENFSNQLILMYKKSIHDDPMVRTYLALSMGQSGKKKFGPILMEGLEDENSSSRVAAIRSLGSIRYNQSLSILESIALNGKDDMERLAATISIGSLIDTNSRQTLLTLLDDEEPNIRWDAAIGLAKLGDLSGKKVIDQLLSRSYYSNFPEVNDFEVEKALLIAIESSGLIKNDDFLKNLEILSTKDPSMKVRDAARKMIKKYNI